MLQFLLRSKTNTFRKLDIRNVGGFRYDIIVGYRYHIFGFGIGFAVLDKPQEVLQA